LEMFTQVARTSFGARVSNLVRALQSTVRPPRARRAPDSSTEPSSDGAGQSADITFSSLDMMYERPVDEGEDRIWQQIDGLRAEGWSAQNEAAIELLELVPSAMPDQLKQIGRGIVAASNEDAVGPVDLANAILTNTEFTVTVRANLLVGMLAEIYFDENGEPAKPAAFPDVTTAIFEHASNEDTKRAYELIIDRLAPFRRHYLALPGEDERQIRLEIQIAQSALVGVQADGTELLEADAPESRRLIARGRSSGASVAGLLVAIAREFVVPVSMLRVDGPTNFQFEIPERIGFINWGPVTGDELR
jgi:hypothetical protein